VKDEKELVFQLEYDPFAQAREPAHGLAAGGRERRIDRAKQERCREPDALERLARDARCQGLDVDDDVGQFRHARNVAQGGRPTLSLETRGETPCAGWYVSTTLKAEAVGPVTPEMAELGHESEG
jgi:hypothetical protein